MPSDEVVAESSIVSPLHAYYCFDVLVAYFEARDPVPPPFESDES